MLLLYQPVVFAARFIAVSALIVLTWLDMRDRRLPLPWVGLVAACYFIQAVFQHVPWADVGAHLLLACLAILGAAMLFRFGWMGGGDVKLAGAVFLWAGWHAGLTVFCVVALAGAALALAMLALDRLASQAQRTRYRVLQAFDVRRGVPYGIALACGGTWAVWAPLS